MSWFRKNLSTIFLLLALFAGLGLLLYPTFSDYWNSLHQSRAIAGYAEQVSQIEDIDYENAYWAWRRQYDAYEADVEAGKTDTVIPESPNKSEYYVQEQDLIEAPGGSVGISLKEGQTLFLDDWCDNVIITIEKTGDGQGLFMD